MATLSSFPMGLPQSGHTSGAATSTISTRIPSPSPDSLARWYNLSVIVKKSVRVLRYSLANATTPAPLPSRSAAARPARGALPDLGLLLLEQREATVLFDANAATNARVRQARWRFTHELDALGTKVLIADIPTMDGVNGPDDLLATEGGDQALAKVSDLARLLPEYAVREATRILDTWPQKFATTEEMIESRKTLLEALARIPSSEDRDALLRPAAKLLKEPLGSIQGAVAARVAHLQKSQREWQEALRVVAHEAELASRKVNPGELIGALQLFFSKRKRSPDGTPFVEALFTLNSYVFDVFDTTPYLSYDSAVPGCGKSVSLEHHEAVCNRAYLGVAPTTATLFRKIDRDAPTWILDEAAVLQAKNGDMAPVMAILNADYKKGAVVPRCEGENGHYTLRDFNVYCPKVFARIGALKGALRDRCIQVHMEKAPGKVPKTRSKFLKKEAASLKKDLEAYAVKFRSELQKLYDEEPEDGYWPQLQGREEELWLPLLMHAKLAGPQYEERALAAAVKFSQAKQANAVDDEKSFALAQELVEVLKEYAEDRFSPGDLVSDLENKECWGEALAKLNERKAKTGFVGRFLSPFRLSSRKRTNKGTSYNREETIEVIMRHTPTASATSATEAENPRPPEVAGANSPYATSEHGNASEPVQSSLAEGSPDDMPPGENTPSHMEELQKTEQQPESAVDDFVDEALWTSHKKS